MTTANPSTARQSVIAFAGHMIDSATRPAPRFPASAEPLIKEALRRELDLLRPAAAVTALASGSDILLVEDLLNRNVDVHVLLPLAVPEFIKESVRPAGESWVKRFQDIQERLRPVRPVEIFGDAYFEGSATPFQLAALLIDGTAELIARERDLDAVTLGVWDGKPGDGMGGAASFMGHAARQGRRVVAIHPSTGQTYTPGAEAIDGAQRHLWGVTRLKHTVLEHRLCTFLFADVAGFGGLRETQVPHFVESIIETTAAALRESGVKPLVLNTWGDGILVVTELRAAAAEVALRLTERAPSVPGAAKPLMFRVALHCGPAFYMPSDPITGKPNVYGTDVNRAARIEPVVEAGQVWASRSFVVMSAATNATGLSFEDVGPRTLRNVGTVHLSRIRRASAGAALGPVRQGGV